MQSVSSQWSRQHRGLFRQNLQGNSWVSGLNILVLFINHNCCGLTQNMEWGGGGTPSVPCQEVPGQFVLCTPWDLLFLIQTGAPGLRCIKTPRGSAQIPFQA